MSTKNRRTVQTPIVIMGDLALLTKQEQAESIDLLEQVDSPTEANETDLEYTD